MFIFGNLLRREGIPKRVFKFNKFSKDSIFKLLHLGHEFIACPTWGSGLYVMGLYVIIFNFPLEG